MNFDQLTTPELAAYFWEYHKDVYGCRPRFVNLGDREAIIRGILALDSYMDWMKSTPEGLAQLRREGWDV